MAALTVSNAHLRDGVWQGLLVAANGSEAAPDIEVVHLGIPLDNVRVTPDGEMKTIWTLSVPIPMELISDGVQTFLVRERAGEETLSRFSIAAGAALEGDFGAELDLLRAELDLLKQAFRRHCVETPGGS